MYNIWLRVLYEQGTCIVAIWVWPWSNISLSRVNLSVHIVARIWRDKVWPYLIFRSAVMYFLSIFWHEFGEMYMWSWLNISPSSRVF